MEDKVSSLLKGGAERIGIILTGTQVKAFNLYLRELSVWKRRMNLIRRESERDIILKDFIDSMTILKHLPFGVSLLDLGSGAGFPGIPVKIVRADIEVFLLEKIQKKVFFLKNMVRVLGLTGIEVHRQRGPNEQDDGDRGEFDFVVSRAFGSLERLSSVGGSWLKRGGILLAMKGKKGKEELAESLPVLTERGWKQGFIDQIRLPFLNHDRTLIGLQKK